MSYEDNAEVWAECKRLNMRITNAEQGVIGLDKTIGAQSAQILELIRRVTELEQLAYSQSVLIQDLQEQAGKQFARLREEQYAAVASAQLGMIAAAE